jgi:hypothetical protein
MKDITEKLFLASVLALSIAGPVHAQNRAAHAQGTDPVAFRALFDATGCPILPSVRYAEEP